MKFVLCFALLCAALSVGEALKCYTCSSTDSWEKCEEIKKEFTCGSGQDRCAKAEMIYKAGGISVKSFAKSCATKQECDNVKEILKACEAAKDAGADATCKADCCSGDLCNAGTAPVVSAILILACAVLALFQ